MVAAELHAFGAITALTFRNPKQITFRESLGIGKNMLHHAMFIAKAWFFLEKQ